MKTTEQTPEARRLIADAAEAQEQFTPDELEQYAEQMRRDLLPLCFAVEGDGSIIDTADPKTRRSHITGENLAEIRLRYPKAELIPLADWIATKTAAQDAPGEWHPVTEEHFHDLLNVLPPAAWRNGAFLVGEASDHHAATGRPRFTCCRDRAGQFAEYSRPMTHAEFSAEFGPGRCFYNS